MAGNVQVVEGTDRRRILRAGLGSRMLQLLSHPIRIEVMRVLRDRVASPKEVADEVGESLGNVSYHFKYLRDAGFVEVLNTEQRRGATEHYYGSTQPKEGAAAVLGDLVAEAATALNSGSFESDDGRCVTLLPIELDQQGRRQLAERQAAWAEELRQIEAAAAKRLAGEPKLERSRVLAGTVAFTTPAAADLSGGDEGR